MDKLASLKKLASVTLIAVAIVLAAVAPSQGWGGAGPGSGGHPGSYRGYVPPRLRGRPPGCVPRRLPGGNAGWLQPRPLQPRNRLFIGGGPLIYGGYPYYGYYAPAYGAGYSAAPTGTTAQATGPTTRTWQAARRRGFPYRLGRRTLPVPTSACWRRRVAVPLGPRSSGHRGALWLSGSCRPLTPSGPNRLDERAEPRPEEALFSWGVEKRGSRLRADPLPGCPLASAPPPCAGQPR